MRLIDRNSSIDARSFTFTDDKNNKFMVDGRETDWNGWMNMIRNKMQNNNIVVPENLEELVEDQMCQKLPKSRCYYTKGAGDRLSKGINTFLTVVDKGAKALGVKSTLAKKAYGCSSCGNRRMKMNQWSAKVL